MDAPALRVLVTAFAPVPGSSPHAAALLGMAAAVRAEMDLLTIKTEQLGHMERHGDTRLFRVPVGIGTPSEQRQAFGRACIRQLESQPYDVVHVRGPLEGLLLAERKQSEGFRFVYEVATYPDEAEGAETEAQWGVAHERCAELADLILVPTEAAARHLGERGHAGKVAVVHPGVDVNTYDFWPAGEGDVARLLYLGSFAADRDLSTVLAAVKIASRRRRVQLLVAGDADPDRRERLRRVVSSFELDPIVTVRGEPRPVMLPMLIGASDVCLAPASAAPRFQDFGDVPQPLLEYLACRRPVVAAGVPGIAEIVRDDREGLLYPPGDQDMLAESILTMIAEDTLRERLVESGYDWVRWQLSDGARRRRIAEVYEMLVPGSQLYDAWVEGFDRELTGTISAPTGELALLDPDDVVDDVSSPSIEPVASAEAAEVLYVAEAERHGGAFTPADTSPGIHSPADDDEIEGVPTEIARTPTEITPHTDAEHRAAGGDDDVETGPVRTPESSR